MSRWAALEQARQLRSLRRPSEALAVLLPLVTANPSDGTVRVAYAAALLDCGQVDVARETARAAVILEPQDVEVLCNAVAVLRGTGPAEEAARLADQALSLAPTSTRAMFEAAMARSDAGDHHGALLLSEHLVQAAPTWASAHNARALVLRHDKRAGSAEAAIRRALELDPDSADLRNNLAIILLSEGKVGAAARTLGDTLAADPRNQTANSNVVVLVTGITMWLYTAALLCAVAQTVVSLVPVVLPVALVLYAAAAAVAWRWWRGLPAGIRRASQATAREHPVKRRDIWIALACLVLGLLAMLARTLVPILVAWGLLYGFFALRFWLRALYQRSR